MSIATLAREARQSLARGLEALQAADAPPALLDVAQHLARAMGVLVDVEAAPSAVAPGAVAGALDGLRQGLEALQLPEHFQHPAAERGMAAVAEALGKVREIERGLEAEAAARPRPVAGKAAGATAGEKQTAPVTAEAPQPATPPKSSAALRAVEAALGAHSATNFYKGLASGDVVASGGLFVETYQAPPVGEKLLLKVSMPGGYEFEATGVVAWTREASRSATASGSPPGFGAQLSEISDEGRGLIQRYVRNREPLFHDDL